MADTIKKETFVVSLAYEMTVNVDTGEILETKLIDRTIKNTDLKPKVSRSPKKVQEDDGEEPKLIMEENKFRLTSAAVALMNLDENSKIVVRYEEGKAGAIPVIGTNTAFGISSGNRLTKSNTVACRGSNHDELAKYGSEFILVPHPSKQGIFLLTPSGNKVPVIEDYSIKVDGNEGEDMPFNLDLSELISEQDENITEVDSDFFNLNS